MPKMLHKSAWYRSVATVTWSPPRQHMSRRVSRPSEGLLGSSKPVPPPITSFEADPNEEVAPGDRRTA